MKSILWPLIGAASLAAASVGLAQSPYLETAPVTILWQFNTTAVSGTTIGPVPTPVDSNGNVGGINPDQLRPVDRITTDVAKPIIFSEGNGDQAFITKHLIRAVFENLAKNGLLSEEDLSQIDSTRWELTAVREPQTTVEGMATTPYTIFLTRVERTANKAISTGFNVSNLDIYSVGSVDPIDDPDTDEFDPVPTATVAVFNTGLFLTFDQFVGNYTETYTGDRVTKATGTVSVAYSINFNSIFGEPAYYSLPYDKRTSGKVGKDYHAKVTTWDAFATGIMTASIRTTASGSLPAITPSKIKMTGRGVWSYAFRDYSNLPDEIIYSDFGGIAPLSIRIGESKFQRRELFPNFNP